MTEPGADAVQAAKRSAVMARVKSRNTGPELAVRSLLHRAGYRFRLHRSDLPGSPDLVFPSRRITLFVHGCFWHGHDCARGSRQPKANAEYWRAKIARNQARDARALQALCESGWSALVVWECELRSADLDARLRGALGPPGPLAPKPTGEKPLSSSRTGVPQGDAT